MPLYNDVIEMARPYLGPAAEQFVSRQVNGHLDVSSDQLTGLHLEELSKWCFISGKLIMAEAKAEEFSRRVKLLKG